MARDDLVVFGDWGTSRLRLSLFDGGRWLADAEGPGIGALTDSPADTLLGALAPWREEHALRRVVLCGMAGSRNGLVEAPYAPCPVDAATWVREGASLSLDSLTVTIAPGLAGTAPSGAADVMRGEETQVFGALALHPDLARGDHWLVLPGTHSKWCHVRDGRILGFQTFLTGELFALLSTRSSLLLGAARFENADEHAAGFAAGLSRARERRLLAGLFETRGAQLRADRSGAWATGFLSGLIIGAEVIDAISTFGVGAVTLIGAKLLTQRYLPVLEEQLVPAQVLSGEDCALAGLRWFAEARS